MKIENQSRKQSYKLDGIGVGRIRTFPFLPIVQFQKISILPPQKGLEFPGGWEVLEDPKI